MKITTTCVLAAGLMLETGCGASSKSREQLHSPYPLYRVEATVRAAEAGDTQAVDRLIDLLEDHDQGVRLYAILALERLCGENYGYRYFDTEPVRAEAVARWREARQRGDVTVRRRTAPKSETSNEPATAARNSPERTQ